MIKNELLLEKKICGTVDMPCEISLSEIDRTKLYGLNNMAVKVYIATYEDYYDFLQTNDIVL